MCVWGWVVILLETPIALHSVAHRLSHQIPAEHPHKSRCRTFLRNPAPPVALSSHSQQEGAKGGVAAGWWRVSWCFLVPKTHCSTGGCHSYSHTSRAALCNEGYSLTPPPQKMTTSKRLLGNYFWKGHYKEYLCHMGYQNQSFSSVL